QESVRCRRQDRPPHRHPRRRRASIRYPDCEGFHIRRADQSAARRTVSLPFRAGKPKRSARISSVLKESDFSRAVKAEELTGALAPKVPLFQSKWFRPSVKGQASCSTF